jgi:hypothetical protein
MPMKVANGEDFDNSRPHGRSDLTVSCRVEQGRVYRWSNAR